MGIDCPIQQGLEVSVSESVDGELPPIDGLQQLMVIGLEEAQRADTPSLTLARSLQISGEFAEPGAVVHRTEGVPIALVGFLGNLAAAVHIRHATPHRPPLPGP